MDLAVGVAAGVGGRDVLAGGVGCCWVFFVREGEREREKRERKRESNEKKGRRVSFFLLEF